MKHLRSNASTAGLLALRQLSRPSSNPTEEHCELCSAALGPGHRHLLETATRRIVCACDPCATCFQGVLDGRFRLIPREVKSLPDFGISDAQWEGLGLPIDLAFFFYYTPASRVVALYPGPAGVVESSLPLLAWSEIAGGHPAISELQPDVEALLVNRTGGRLRAYLLPIDHCFRLAGLIRLHWRGFTGGTEVWREIEGYFAGLDAQAEPAGSALKEVDRA